MHAALGKRERALTSNASNFSQQQPAFFGAGMTRARAIERGDAESMSGRGFIELEIIQFLQQAPGRCTHCIIATLGNNFYYWGLPALARWAGSHAPSTLPRPKSLPASLQSSL